MAISQGDWVYCENGTGWLFGLDGRLGDQELKFRDHSVGRVEKIEGRFVDLWLIGPNEKWRVPRTEAKRVKVDEVGDQFSHKICNICHRRLTVDKFSVNQINSKGRVRRPSCKRCRIDIDRRPKKPSQAKRIAQQRPKKGDLFICPICLKRSIVDVTANIVADHDHHTGNFRAFMCGSCNTGLGRFKDDKVVITNAKRYLEQHDSLDL
ncbi:Hpy99I family type II restriction endonuclease [Candidatus Spongiisocius sp.]|uniref:Hpy99I family type II restriction endonuclease n=1 Tax=Candidatus Spongiisocius sp. TaxID=3101273 RepID=UPI003B59D83C